MKTLIIYTGGTIGMIKDPVLNVYIPISLKLLQSSIPELTSYDLHFLSGEVIDSSNMNPDYWFALAKMIWDNYDNYKGFVILHGTDTMAYTASALSFIFENLSKPIILTGSQLPLQINRTDAKENLMTAIDIASATTTDGLAQVPEVSIYFDGKLFRGNRVFKYSAEDFKAFDSPNYPPLAKVGVHIQYEKGLIQTPSNILPLKIYSNFNKYVWVVKIFPGMSINIFSYILDAPSLKGIVLETFGAGNALTDKTFLGILKKIVDKGIIVVNHSQCYKGSVDMGRYETSFFLQKIGILSGWDMTFEATITKLMFVCGLTLDLEEQKQLFSKNLRGEMTIF